MIFDFLRKFFRDKKLERTEAALNKATNALLDFEIRINSLEEKFTNEKKKKFIEPDFIALLWTFLVLVAITTNNAATDFVPLLDKLTIPRQSLSWEETFVLIGKGIIYFVGLVFIIRGGILVYSLLLEYAESKNDFRYKDFAVNLKYFFIAIFIGTIFVLISPALGLAFQAIVKFVEIIQ